MAHARWTSRLSKGWPEKATELGYLAFTPTARLPKSLHFPEISIQTHHSLSFRLSFSSIIRQMRSHLSDY
jgi:hypothetical protein